MTVQNSGPTLWEKLAAKQVEMAFDSCIIATHAVRLTLLLMTMNVYLTARGFSNASNLRF